MLLFVCSHAGLRGHSSGGDVCRDNDNSPIFTLHVLPRRLPRWILRPTKALLAFYQPFSVHLLLGRSWPPVSVDGSCGSVSRKSVVGHSLLGCVRVPELQEVVKSCSSASTRETMPADHRLSLGAIMNMLLVEHPSRCVTVDPDSKVNADFFARHWMVFTVDGSGEGFTGLVVGTHVRHGQDEHDD